MSLFLSNWNASKDQIIFMDYLLNAKVLLINFLVCWI